MSTTDFYAQPGEATEGTVHTAMGGDWSDIAAGQAERSDVILVINMGPQHPSTHGVLRLILEGKPMKLIARELGLRPHTTKTHVSAVLRALAVTTRTQAIVAANRMGLVLGDDASS